MPLILRSNTQRTLGDTVSPIIGQHLSRLLKSGQGDCEDYAIVKYALLRAMMWPANELRIVIVWDGRSRDYHAVEATHLGHAWLILDNASLIISEDVNVRNYHPLFIITELSVRQLRRPAAADEAKAMKWNKMN